MVLILPHEKWTPRERWMRRLGYWIRVPSGVAILQRSQRLGRLAKQPSCIHRFLPSTGARSNSTEFRAVFPIDSSPIDAVKIKEGIV
jgi:hypothetical protein